MIRLNRPTAPSAADDRKTSNGHTKQKHKMKRQVNVLSLDGGVALNFVVDPVAVANSETLAVHFIAELGALTEKVGVDASAEISGIMEEAAKLVGVMEAAAKAAPPATQS